MGLTVSSVHVDSSLLSGDVSEFCTPPYANSFVDFTSCSLLQYFAKWFLFPHRIHSLLVPLSAATVSCNLNTIFGLFCPPPSCALLV